jgi:serine/threonine-protein kinase HipA
VIVVPRGESPVGAQAGLEPLEPGDVADLIEDLPTRPLGVGQETGIRLSLAGQQSKLLLNREAGKWQKPIHGHPSTYILKPEPTHYPGLSSNELLCLCLAKEVGLDVAEAHVEHFGKHATLVVARFDRAVGKDGSVVRIHQEDVLTALGVDPLYKYEHDDDYGSRGPSLAAIAGLIDRHLGLVANLSILESVVFNVVIGNADAHARNLSLLLRPDGTVELAPLYDLVSTVHADALLNRALSQRIADQSDIDEVTVDDLLVEADSWGLAASVTGPRVTRVVASVRDRLPAAVQAALAAGGDEGVLAGLAGLIEQRAMRLIDGT